MSAKISQSLSGRRALRTINDAVAGYYADVILFRRLFRQAQLRGEFHPEALSKIFEIAYRAYQQAPWNLIQLTWPLLMAGLETEDPIHRDWISK